VSARGGASFTAARIAARVAVLGREITRSAMPAARRGRHAGPWLCFRRGFDREIGAPVICHFVREDVRDVDMPVMRARSFFGSRRELKGRDVLLVDAVLESGVIQEFLLRRLGESQPRSIRLAVLLDKPARRRVGLEPITLASGLHLRIYGLVTAWPRPMVRMQSPAAFAGARAVSAKGGKRRKK